jgi:hypothetical protein
LEPTIEYAAAYYLSIWQGSDRLYTQALGHPECLGDEKNRPALLKCVVEAATDYSVVRGFKKVQTEQDRLLHLLDSLQKAKPPSNDVESIQEVMFLIDLLDGFYHKKLVSAASKFLWFRFKNPVIIYDSYAYRGLELIGFAPDRRWSNDHTKWYPEYVSAWRDQYGKLRFAICQACSDLVAVKKFTSAYAIEEDRLQKLVAEEWFRERVFDAYLMLRGTPSVTAKAEHTGLNQAD